jgi:hypothetical protein
MPSFVQHMGSVRIHSDARLALSLKGIQVDAGQFVEPLRKVKPAPWPLSQLPLKRTIGTDGMKASFVQVEHLARHGPISHCCRKKTRTFNSQQQEKVRSPVLSRLHISLSRLSSAFSDLPTIRVTHAVLAVCLNLGTPQHNRVNHPVEEAWFDPLTK